MRIQLEHWLPTYWCPKAHVTSFFISNFLEKQKIWSGKLDSQQLWTSRTTMKKKKKKKYCYWPSYKPWYQTPGTCDSFRTALYQHPPPHPSNEAVFQTPLNTFTDQSGSFWDPEVSFPLIFQQIRCSLFFATKPLLWHQGQGPSFQSQHIISRSMSLHPMLYILPKYQV